MLTLNSPVQVTFSTIQLRSLKADDAPSLALVYDTVDGAGNRDTLTLAVDAKERQGIKVVNGRLAVYTDPTAGYAATLLSVFTASPKDIATGLKAVESRMLADGLLLAGTVA